MSQRKQTPKKHINKIKPQTVAVAAISTLLDGNSYSTRDIYEEAHSYRGLSKKKEANLINQTLAVLKPWIEAGILKKDNYKDIQHNTTQVVKNRNENKHGPKGSFYTLDPNVINIFNEKKERINERLGNKNEEKSNESKSIYHPIEDHAVTRILDSSIEQINILVKDLPVKREEDVEGNFDEIDIALSFTPSEKKLYDLFLQPEDNQDIATLITSYKQEEIAKHKALFSTLHDDEDINDSDKHKELIKIKQYKELIESSDPLDLYKANLLYWFIMMSESNDS